MSKSAFLVNLQLQKKDVTLSCFEHRPANYILVLKPVWFSDGARLLSDVAWGLTLSSDNYLDFDAEIRSVLPIF